MMLALLLGLVALTAFFNLAEMALVASRTARLDQAENKRAAGVVLDLKKRPGLFLAAIRAGDLLTDLLTGAFVVTWLEGALKSFLARSHVLEGYASITATVIAFAAVSYIVLVFGDLAPKSVALSAPERSAMLIGSPLRIFILIARPFFSILERSNTLVLRLIGVKEQSQERVSQEEIRRLLAEGLSAGVLLSFERSMLERVLDLDRRSVRTMMTGRRYVQSLRADADAVALRSSVLALQASQLLVTRAGDLDDLLGTVSRADVLAALAQGEAVDLAAMATPPAYVAENASGLSVLEFLKNSAGHMVVALDEFGSTVGLATFADVLEAVAGDAPFVAGAPGIAIEGPISPEPDGSFLLGGGQPVDDIAEILPLPLPVDRNYKTIAGFVLDRLKRIPEVGEQIELEALRVEVVSVDRGAITSVRLTRLEPRADTSALSG